MVIRFETAPGLPQLRPARAAERTPGFPVYHDIEKVLASPDPDPRTPVDHSSVAHVLATCAAYSYGDAATLAMIMARLGMLDNRVLEIGQEVDALLITSTAYVVQSADGRTVLVAYRGTRPTGVIDWLGDLDVTPEKLRIPLPGADAHSVHAGFYRNVRSTRAEVITALDRAARGRAIGPIPEEPGEETPEVESPMESLHITGHSLGGAMAALAAVLLAAETEPQRRAIATKLRSVHTFGQPMVGSTAFAAAAGRVPWPGLGDIGDRTTLGDHLQRWIYRKDVVAQLPPTASGDWAHFGRERRYTPDGLWRPAEPTRPISDLLALGLAPLALLFRSFAATRDRWPGPSIEDHLPEHYLTHLAPPDITSEYGD
jgi:hypothetical protein